MECKYTMFDDDKDLTPDDKEIKRQLRYSLDAYSKDPVVRLLMTGAGKGAGASFGEWRTWAENILNSSLDNVTVKDAQWIAAQTRGLVKSTKRALFKDEASVREYLIKAATLPYDLFAYHGIGNIHERMSIADQIRSQRVSGLDLKIQKLSRSIEGLAGMSLQEADNLFKNLNEEVERTNAVYNVLKKKPGESQANIEAARVNWERAKEKLNLQTSNDSLEANNSARVLRLIAEYLNGEPSVYSSDPEVSKKRLLAKLGKGADYGTVTRVINEARELTDHFKSLLLESKGKFRDMLYYELEGIMAPDEAKQFADEITQFHEEESYYPHHNLVSLYQRVNGLLEAHKAIMDTPRDGLLEKLNDIVATQRTAHTKVRKGGGLIDYNMISVFKQYGKEVYDHAHAADVGIIASSFVRELGRLDTIRNAAGNPESKEVMYANSVRRLLMAHVNQIFDRKVATVTDEALGTISAFQVFSKLTNPSTTINNRLEGILQYMSHSGITHVAQLRKLKDVYKNDIDEALREAHTDFNIEDVVDIHNLANNKLMRKVLNETDMLDVDELRKMEIAHRLSEARGLMGKISTLGLKAVLWPAAENANRREAFELGAAAAAEHVNTSWRDLFLQGKWTPYLEKEYDLNKDLLVKAKEGKMEDREALFRHFRNKYILRQGYRSMFQTQFQYSETSRNFMDLNAKTSWITMFQHYPRSLASAVMWAMHDVQNLVEVGGVSALKGQISSMKYGESKTGLGKWANENLTMNHRLNHVVTLAGIAMLRNAVRLSTGWVMFNVMQTPFTQIMQDLYDYFVDDQPQSKQNRAWELMYGRDQPVRQFIGPTASTALDVASVPAKEFLQAMDGVGMALIEVGIRDGSMGQYLSDSLGGLGLRTTNRALTDNGRKDYTDAMSVVRDYGLSQFAVYGKGQSLVNSLVAGDPNKIAIESLRMAGIRPDWNIIKEKQASNKEFRQ